MQGANADSSRTGQWDNSQGFIGLSNKTYGTITVGRVNTLSLDAINSYDPMGGSYAFSPLGFLGFLRRLWQHRSGPRQYGGQIPVGFSLPRLFMERISASAGLVQWGGYDQGNGTNGLYQGQVGADFNLFGGNALGGVLSMDFIGSWAKDAANIGHLHRNLLDADDRAVRRSDRLHVRHSNVL